MNSATRKRLQWRVPASSIRPKQTAVQGQQKDLVLRPSQRLFRRLVDALGSRRAPALRAWLQGVSLVFLLSTWKTG